MLDGIYTVAAENGDLVGSELIELFGQLIALVVLVHRRVAVLQLEHNVLAVRKVFESLFEDGRCLVVLCHIQQHSRSSAVDRGSLLIVGLLTEFLEPELHPAKDSLGCSVVMPRAVPSVFRADGGCKELKVKILRELLGRIES